MKLVLAASRWIFFYVALTSVLIPHIPAVAETDGFEVYELLDTLDRSENYHELMDTIGLLSHYRFKEVADAFLQRLEKEAVAIMSRRTAIEGPLPESEKELEKVLGLDIYYHLLVKFAEVATVGYQAQLKLAMRPLLPLVEEAPNFQSQLTRKVIYFVGKTKDRETPLPSLAAMLKERGRPVGGTLTLVTKTKASPDQARAKAIARYNEAIENLSARIKGQPEVVQALADLEFRNAVYFASRVEPVKIMLMGQPGTGKDTSAQAYVDFIYGQKDAYQDELYLMPVLRNEADLWKVLGSNTGYIGSRNLPPIFKFLVNHSGGRYRIDEKESASEGKRYAIVNNPNYQGEVLPGYAPPEKAVIYVNEFHNWSKEMKDALKDTFDKGIWTINNPNGGLDKITVPVTFIFATNEGSALVTSRELNGERFGPALNFKQMLAKWEAVNGDKETLRNELKRSNGAVNQRSGQSGPGYSEEFLNRIPDAGLILMRPLSPEHLQEVAEAKLVNLSERLSGTGNQLGKMDLHWTPNVTAFVRDFKMVAEDMARPIQSKTENLIEATILDALKAGEIPLVSGGASVLIDVVSNTDRTTSLDFTVFDRGDNIVASFKRPIRATEADKAKEVMDKERIDHLRGLPRYLKDRVFGLDETIIDRLSRSILLAEEAKNGREDENAPKDGAKIMAFFGLSSSGKTETTSVLADFLYGRREAKRTIDFSQVQSVQDIKDRILGTRDHHGNPIPSEFMKEYDRAQGRGVLFVFDELANAPKWALKALYDVFREPIVTTFSDNKARSMNGVHIVITGNAGEEWYQGIPRDVPEMVQMFAMRQVYEQGVSNPNLSRALLEKYFSEALINRIGERNIFFFPPANFKSVRQLGQFKLMQAIEALKPREGRYGWHIEFESEETFKDLMDLVDQHGFVIREQGASVDRFVKQELEAGIRHLLLQQKVPSGSHVVLTRLKRNESIVSRNGRTYQELRLRLSSDNGQILTLVLQGKDILHWPSKTDEDRLITAAHEAGHAIVGAVLFKGINRPTFLSIIPGVTNINEEWILYNGIASQNQERDPRITREVVINRMAVLAAGEVAEQFVTKGRRTDAGKSNDMERATTLAYQAILKWGLSERWGTMAVPTGMSMEEYIRSLPEDRRRLLYEEVDSWIKEARELARLVIALNIESTVVPLAIEVAEKGQLYAKDFEKFFASHRLVEIPQGKPRLNPQHLKWLNGQPALSRVDMELVDWMPRPKKVATLEELVELDRQKQVAQVELPKDLPLVQDRPKKGRKARRGLSFFEDVLPVESSAQAPCENILSGDPQG